MSKKNKPLFEKVPKPIIDTRKNIIYKHLIEEIEKQETGWYKINTDALGVKVNSAYTVINKRIKGKPLKIHLINKTLYLEKT